MRIALIWLAVLLAACSAPRESWRWVRADGSTDPRELAQDIDACEEEAETLRDDGLLFKGTPGARPYGGWGDFDFEFCMHQRNWQLKFLPPPAPRNDRGS